MRMSFDVYWRGRLITSVDGIGTTEKECNEHAANSVFSELIVTDGIQVCDCGNALELPEEQEDGFCEECYDKEIQRQIEEQQHPDAEVV